MRVDEPAPTLTTRCTTPACGRFLHPVQHRGITLREAALIQTFPKRYVFDGSYQSIEGQIGNAVPVRMAQGLAMAAGKLLLGAGSPADESQQKKRPHTRLGISLAPSVSSLRMATAVDETTAPPHELTLAFHGRVIDHLGIQMYQSPIAAVAELVSNAWDADAEHVAIRYPETLDATATLAIEDDGVGMTFEQVQDHYLEVGRNRRGDNPDSTTSGKGRPVLGRKGIGKFAGFGIAQVIDVKTISAENGELTCFPNGPYEAAGRELQREGACACRGDRIQPS